MQQNKKLFSSIRALTAAAMLTAMSVIIGIVCKTALNFSNGLLRITFENLPIILSGILFGPVVGGVVGAASDLISYLLSPQTYPPNLVVTLGALLVGVTSGLVARFAVRKQGSLQIVLSGALAHVVGSMIVKTIGLFQYYSWAVLVRIPLYLVIASLEILLLCWLFRRRSFRRIIEKL
ncbi:MAG: folate family ECF transporter S component [Clostridia bacterium]|nr:folate family ECF transporter S component [Clostridia bacterium]